MNKKEISIVVIFTLFSLLSVCSMFMIQNKYQIKESNIVTNAPPSVIPFVYGTTGAPYYLDPVDCADPYSRVVIDQVAETLFTYDFNDPTLPLIPLLAVGYILEPTEKLNYTIQLRQSVKFHDGSKFNATVAKWNFDRMEYWWNFTGDLPIPEIPGNAEVIYEYEDEEMPIWNHTEIVGPYTIKIILNKPYAGFLHLLTYSAAVMLSMESTPFFAKLDLGTDLIIGTGPFVYEYYLANEIKFHAFNNYWWIRAQIDELIFAYYSDTVTLNIATLADDVHFLDQPLPTYLDTFKAAPHLDVIDDGKTDGAISYIAFNNNLLNSTIRKALSYAINYTYYIEGIRENTASKLKSPVPQGILYSDTSLDYPYFNITKAREIMQSMGHGKVLDPTYPGVDDGNWDSLADTGTYNFSMWVYQISPVYYDVFNICQEGFRKIGINIYMKESWFGEFIINMEINPDWLDMWLLGWSSEYNDPSNYINYLFSNTSKNNLGQVNDLYLQNLIEFGNIEHDPLLREDIYNEIQRDIVEELYPMAWLSSNKMYHVYNSNFSGFSQNVLERTYFYNCEWKPYTYNINIISPGDISFIVGTTGNSITWTLSSDHLENPLYYIYRNNVEIEYEAWENGVPIIVDLDNLAVGTYEYKIEVYNEFKTAEDIITVTVKEASDSQPGKIPGYSVFLIGGISAIIIIYVYRNFKIKQLSSKN